MQTQSGTYDAFPGSRTVKSYVRFEFLDIDADTNATATSGDADAISDLDQLNDGIETASDYYPALEPDLLVLNGTSRVLPDDTSALQIGFWSDELSGADGTFTTPPKVRFTNGGSEISVIGYVLFFDDKVNQYPTSIKITTYDSDGTTAIDQGTVANNSTYAVLNFPSSGYYVDFEFLETSESYRRVRMIERALGIVQIFADSTRPSMTLEYGADIAAESFPSRELEFTFDNLDHAYNLLSPNSLFEYLQDNQSIVAKIIMDGEAVEMGTFYYTSAEAADGAITAKITANDLILSLDDAVYNSGATGSSTLATMVTAILSGTGITANYDTGLSTTSVSTAIPQDTSKREAIRLLAQASCCTCWMDRDGVLQFADLTVGTSVDTLTGDELYNWSGISIADKVGSVELVVKDEYADTENTYTSGTDTPVKTIRNPCVAAANGNTVAAWLLSCYQRRKKYNVKNRCNPAVEISDTITIYDVYGENADATATGISITYDGGLYANTKAVGA